MTYSVNGQAPFFINAQDARAYAIEEPSLASPMEWHGTCFRASRICQDGRTVGFVIPAPNPMGSDLAYWGPADCSTVFPLNADGTYDPYDVSQICLEPTVYLEPSYGLPLDLGRWKGERIPFESRECAFRWFIERCEAGVVGSVYDSEGSEMGRITKVAGEPAKTIYAMPGRCYEVARTGRLSKPYDLLALARQNDVSMRRGVA